MEHQFNNVNEGSLKTVLKIHKKKKTPNKFITNITTTDNIQTDGTEILKVTNYKYLGQTTAMESRTRQDVLIRIKAGWSDIGKYRESF